MSEVAPVRYRSADEDSDRWLDFPFRQGDIVISTRSKSGTTWMQMICALLVFQSGDLPEPLGRLSPWIDWTGTPSQDLLARLAGQKHRRFMKTHTPLDGIPLDDRATYIVVGRHPLDMAVSLYHQGENIDRRRLRELTGQPEPLVPPPPRPPLHEWLLSWIDWDGDRHQEMDSLSGVVWHASDAWGRRHQPNVILVHYEDLSTDLEGEMHRLAALLGITVSEGTWRKIVPEASFESMRARVARTAPDPADILKDRSQFFRRGTSGAGRELLTSDEHARYQTRIESMAPPDVVTWLQQGSRSPGTFVGPWS
ncbi:MAG TPA: sulfotransferase domain-containing protein [Acidimicrobiales bacterium]